MNTPDDSGVPSPCETVSRLLTSLLAEAGREIAAGNLTVARPGELLDAARLLLELDGAGSGEPADDVGREIVGRLGAELGLDDEP
jgi:hypothetical protein